MDRVYVGICSPMRAKSFLLMVTQIVNSDSDQIVVVSVSVLPRLVLYFVGCFQ